MRPGKSIAALGVALVITLPLAAGESFLSGYRFDDESMSQWRLPDRLNEISGLALTDDGRVLSVTDEVAIIYELDFESGRLVKAFAFGKPVVKGDFEGIAVIDDTVYLTTSKGKVLFGPEGVDGERAPFDTFKTDLGDECEIEGLAASHDGALLFFLCKNVKKKARVDGLTVFAWSVADRELVDERTLTIPESEIMSSLRVDRLSPSGLSIVRESGNFVVLAGRQRALFELSAEGEFIEARPLLLAARHRQAEGITIAARDLLLIADEGGAHKARLAVYEAEEADDGD